MLLLSVVVSGQQSRATGNAATFYYQVSEKSSAICRRAEGKEWTEYDRLIIFWAATFMF